MKIFAINTLAHLPKVVNSLNYFVTEQDFMMRIILPLALFLSIWIPSFGQDTTLKYRAPVDIPMVLSGNFGEFRNNHFHTGIDIKTQGVQGKTLYAIADGFISRINISPYGYGKALYIDHPDGNTSVYAHMKEFNKEIEDFILQKQYEMESFEMEYYPSDTIFPLKMGDIIGLSGNTGHSGGPHLHFEIRETVSEHPVNPLQFGFNIKDQVDPILKGVRLYPIETKGTVEGHEDEKSFTVSLTKNGKYRLSKDTVMVGGEIGLAVHTIDKMINVNNTFSVYYLKVFANEKLLYAHTMDELDFETSRYLNCHMDYNLFHKNKWKYHKCFPAENNQLKIYENPGTTITFANGDIKDIRIEAGDIDGNTIECSFVLKGTKYHQPDELSTTERTIFNASDDNVFENEDVHLLIPKGVLYDDMAFSYSTTNIAKGNKSKIFGLGSSMTAMQDYAFLTLNLEPEDSANANIKLYHIDKKGRYKMCKSEVKGNVIQGSFKSFGQYVLKEDVTKPTITLNNFPKAPSKRNSKIAFKLSDNLSGVKTIRAMVDGQWLKMKYNASLSYTYGSLKELDLDTGAHELSLEVQDACGNKQTYSKKFNWTK